MLALWYGAGFLCAFITSGSLVSRGGGETTYGWCGVSLCIHRHSILSLSPPIPSPSLSPTPLIATPHHCAARHSPLHSPPNSCPVHCHCTHQCNHQCTHHWTRHWPHQCTHHWRSLTTGLVTGLTNALDVHYCILALKPLHSPLPALLHSGIETEPKAERRTLPSRR
jgi:hypothetical protein